MATRSFPGVKRRWGSANHPPPSTAEVANGPKLYVCLPSMPPQACSGDSFTVTPYLLYREHCIPGKRLQNNPLQTDTFKSPLQCHMLKPFFLINFVIFSPETKSSIPTCDVHVSTYCHHQGKQSTTRFTLTFPNVKTLPKTCRASLTDIQIKCTTYVRKSVQVLTRNTT